MLDRPSIAVKKSVVLRVGALLAMMAMLVLSNPAPNGIFAHPHTPAVEMHDGVAADTDEHIHIHYAENGTDAVRDFDSTDPERAAIEWNVRGVDAADFEISSTGVLTFMESPDFENPTDRGLNLNPGPDGNETFEDDGEFAPNDNNYQITVSATEMSDALPAKRTDMALTVVVGNEDDTGELTLQWLQPEVGTPIRATLTDPDGFPDSPAASVWTWSTSKVFGIPDVNDESNWNTVTGAGFTSVGTPTDADKNTVSSYTPQGDTVDGPDDSAVDEGRHLRVKVDYTDAHGVGKTRYGISMNPVRAEVSSPGDNGSPDFEEDADTRSVPESTAVGDPVGDRVTAADPDDDTLTYELDNDVVFTNDLAADSDLQFFDIDMETGQIEVAQELDYDAVEGRAAGVVAGTYTVVVRATDPSGLADNITVTITAENVNEDPVVTGRAELSVAEGITGAAYEGLPDAPPITRGPEPTNQQNEYVYEEPDQRDSIARWTLEGDDAGAFDNSGRFEPRYLQFKTAPDYENPSDMNKDNVYEVTLVATDDDPLGTGAGIGKVNVWLIVTNVDEAGKVVFTQGGTAFLDEMLVAEVQDPDDHGGFDDMGEPYGEPYQGVHIVRWQWSRAFTDVTGTEFEDIVGATTKRYTAKSSDRGYYLRATATYTDPLSDPDDPETPEDDRISTEATEGETPSLRTEMATTDNAVKVGPDQESAPTFPDTTGTVTREVAEDTGPGGNVGAPVAAMAATGNETLTYTLEGTDAKYFNIDNVGQITVGGDDPSTQDVTELGTDPELDYEKKKMFSVTVKVEVTDGDANQKVEVDVNIMVTDVDDEPVITDEDVDKPPMTAIMYPEVEDGAPNTAVVATYVGTDPEGDSISWDLRGADAALFTIDGGVLKFRNAPDYENPKDVDGDLTDGDDGTVDNLFDDTVTPDAVAGNNKYNIVIRAIASRDSGDTGPAETVDTTVTVTVTDVDEKGEVVISWLQPEVGFAITASLTDPDGAETAITWAWKVSKVEPAVLLIGNPKHWGPAPGTATDESYTPADIGTEGRYLRVTAMYTDRNGSGKTAWMRSAYPVQAADGGRENGSPDFVAEKVDRSVAETAAVGADVNPPVTAPTGGSSAKDTLTYGLRAFVDNDVGSTGLDVPDTAVADAAAFNIDKASGQITLAAKLDFESRSDGKYVVVATVTDPSGLNDDVVVVITAEDRNEDPVLSGRSELTIDEIDSGAEDAANPDFDGNPEPEEQTPAVATVNVYNVVDEDSRAETQSWDLKGVDAGEFQLISTVGRTLVFRNQPDYENPTDADGDNVYKVTVVTLDGDGGRAEFDVCIAVTNINEIGKITLRDEDGNELNQPYAHGPITADLTDPDGGVTDADVEWVWSRSQNDPPTDDPTAVDPAATSDTYTPTNADTGYFLSVTATYMDAKNDAPTDPPDSEARTAKVTAAFAVLEVEDKGQDPAFPEYPEDGIGADGTVTVEVAENSPSGTYVGEAILAAVDPDKGTTLIYTLGGDDAALFDRVVNTRQIQIVVAKPLVRAGTGDGSDPEMDAIYDLADLDHEGDKKTYTVMLKASDGNDDTDDATITVTITVTNRNEAPSTPMVASGEAPTPDANNAPEFPSTEDGMRSVAENTAAGENIGAPVEATDTDAGDTLMYTLGGTDMASFAIDDTTGQLMTMAALDYEDPADADTDNAYEVTVTASDGNAADDATIAVTITVTDVTTGNADGDTYDANEDGVIDGPEVIQAVKDYFAGKITGPEVIAVVKLYFAGRSS